MYGGQWLVRKQLLKGCLIGTLCSLGRKESHSPDLLGKPVIGIEVEQTRASSLYIKVGLACVR